MNILKTTLSVSVHYDDRSPIFGEGVTHVSVEDEAAGPFIVLKQVNDKPFETELRFDLKELETVLTVARELLKKYPEEKK